MNVLGPIFSLQEHNNSLKNNYSGLYVPVGGGGGGGGGGGVASHFKCIAFYVENHKFSYVTPPMK